MEILDQLIEADVVSDDDELQLDSMFLHEWQKRMRDRSIADPEIIADELVRSVTWVSKASIVTEGTDTWIQLSDGTDSVQTEAWLSVSAAVAELTALETLKAQTDLSDRSRAFAAPPLRGFLNRCPACDDRLSIAPSRSCCGGPHRDGNSVETVLGCPTCGDVVAIVDES